MNQTSWKSEAPAERCGGSSAAGALYSREKMNFDERRVELHVRTDFDAETRIDPGAPL
jgi:hypothetical protein